MNQSVDNMAWAAYNTSHQPAGRRVICSSAIFPLFHESAHTAAMVKHTMDVVRKAVQHLNAGQTPVVTFDQPLYAIAKQIQWKWPEMYGEDKFVVMFGCLHIEMAGLRTLGCKAVAGTSGGHNSSTADSLRAAHVAFKRRAHQVTAAALYILSLSL